MWSKGLDFEDGSEEAPNDSVTSDSEWEFVNPVPC